MSDNTEHEMKARIEQQAGIKPAGLSEHKPVKKSKSRGRSRAGLTQDEIEESRVPIEADRLDDKMRRVLAQRASMSSQAKLGDYYANDQENFHYFWENDYNNKIQDRKNWFWEHVVDGAGNNVCVQHGRDVKFLMKIPIAAWNYYRELQDKERRGKINRIQSLKSDEYLPDGRTYALQKDSLNPYINLPK